MWQQQMFVRCGMDPLTRKSVFLSLFARARSGHSHARAKDVALRGVLAVEFGLLALVCAAARGPGWGNASGARTAPGCTQGGAFTAPPHLVRSVMIDGPSREPARVLSMLCPTHDSAGADTESRSGRQNPYVGYDSVQRGDYSRLTQTVPSTVLLSRQRRDPVLDPIQIRKTHTPDSHPVGIGLAGWVFWLRESDAQQSMLGTSLHSAKVTPTPALM